MADLVNVAGKRSSFAYLNTQLNAIPGVVDGAFFLSDAATGSTGVARLGAAVIAPGLSAAELTARLRQRIDTVFLPRPLLMVEQLPRNATGKLPLQALKELAHQQLQTIVIAADHPAFAGHFPTFPVLPGAVLLDEVMQIIQRQRGLDLREWKIASAKFLEMVRPGDVLRVEHEAEQTGLIRFTLLNAKQPVARGTLCNDTPAVAAP